LPSSPKRTPSLSDSNIPTIVPPIAAVPAINRPFTPLTIKPKVHSETASNAKLSLKIQADSPACLVQGKPLHDPMKEGAVVMMRPDTEHGIVWNKRGGKVIDVVIDPILSDKLLDHQKE
jgi:hypothetical protein